MSHFIPEFAEVKELSPKGVTFPVSNLSFYYIFTKVQRRQLLLINNKIKFTFLITK